MFDIKYEGVSITYPIIKKALILRETDGILIKHHQTN